MSEDQGFKRINFFKGFVTTTKDWNDAELYHVEKHKLHNRCFHGAGVVPGYRQELAVRARGRADMSVEIAPGYAIDGQGNDMLLYETEIKSISKSDFKLPLTVYIVLKYVEEFTDFIAYKENLDFKGHRRIQEKAVVELSITEPNILHEVEIARIALTEDAKKITDAKDPLNPGPNEIDTRFVPKAGVVGGYLPMDLIMRLRAMLRAQRDFFYRLARDKKVLSANSVALGFMTLEMLLESGSIGPQNIMQILAQLGTLQWDTVNEIEATKPTIKAMKDFGQFKHSVEVFRDLVDDKTLAVDENDIINFDSLDQVITVQEKSAYSLSSIVGEQIHAEIVDEEPSISNEWTKIKEFSGEMPEVVTIDGQEWTLIDAINVWDKESEQAHAFQVCEARDSWHSRQRLRYPDGTTVEDVGIAHEGGYTSFEIHNVTPNRPIMLLRRMDYARGDAEIEYSANDVRVGICQCNSSDRRFRWRNWPFLIPAEYVSSEILTMTQKVLTADRDINMFHFWFYQAL